MRQRVLESILTAFEGVELEDGVSLREADVIDDYGGDEARAAARKQDELHDWQRIPDEDIEYHSFALCFMDDEGLRFHLPAYIRFELNRAELSIDDPAFMRLTSVSEELRLLLSDQQRAAVRLFLLAHVKESDSWGEVAQTAHALRLWHGIPEEAIDGHLHLYHGRWIEEFKQLWRRDRTLAMQSVCQGLSKDEYEEVLNAFRRLGKEGNTCQS